MSSSDQSVCSGFWNLVSVDQVVRRGPGQPTRRSRAPATLKNTPYQLAPPTTSAATIAVEVPAVPLIAFHVVSPAPSAASKAAALATSTITKVRVENKLLGSAGPSEGAPRLGMSSFPSSAGWENGRLPPHGSRPRFSRPAHRPSPLRPLADLGLPPRRRGERVRSCSAELAPWTTPEFRGQLSTPR